MDCGDDAAGVTELVECVNSDALIEVVTFDRVVAEDESVVLSLILLAKVGVAVVCSELSPECADMSEVKLALALLAAIFESVLVVGVIVLPSGCVPDSDVKSKVVSLFGLAEILPLLDRNDVCTSSAAVVVRVCVRAEWLIDNKSVVSVVSDKALGASLPAASTQTSAI